MLKAEIVHQISHAEWARRSADRRRRRAGAPIEMIEVRVRHEHEIDVRQIDAISKPGMLQALDHLEPLRPVRIDQHIESVRLDEKRGVADPGDAQFRLLDLGKVRQPAFAGALGEERRDEDLVRKLRLCQSAPGRSRRAWSCSYRPFSDAWTRFRRLFLEKGIGTGAQPYKLGRVNQNLSRRAGELRR